MEGRRFIRPFHLEHETEGWKALPLGGGHGVVHIARIMGPRRRCNMLHVGDFDTRDSGKVILCDRERRCDDRHLLTRQV